MSISQIFRPLATAVRRTVIHIELNHIKYQLAHIESTRVNDRLAARVQHRRQALLLSDLARLDG